MNKLIFQWFVFTSLVFTIQGKKICDLSNVECTTNGAKHTFKIVLAAFKDISPDLIYQEKIEDRVEVLKYTAINATLAGMSQCAITTLILQQSEETFNYNLRCPQLVLKSYFETDGPIGGLQINGKGETTITIDDVLVLTNGDYGKYISKDDQNLRVFIKSYDVNVEPKGKVTFELNKLFEGDKDKFDQAINFMNENWMEVEKLFRKSLIKHFLRGFFDNFNVALQTIPLEEILPMQE